MGLYCAIPVSWITEQIAELGALEVAMGQAQAASEASRYPPDDQEEAEDFYDVCWGYDEAEVPEFNINPAVEAFKSAFDNVIYTMCPVRTGFLRSSCHCEISNELIECFADAEYAQYVEYGTSRMAPQPYFEPAIMAGLQAFIEINGSCIDQFKRDVEKITQDAVQDIIFSAADFGSLILALIIAILITAVIEVILSIFDPMWDDFRAAIAEVLFDAIDIQIE